MTEDEAVDSLLAAFPRAVMVVPAPAPAFDHPEHAKPGAESVARPSRGACTACLPTARDSDTHDRVHDDEGGR
jgi:hypothetical protein